MAQFQSSLLLAFGVLWFRIFAGVRGHVTLTFPAARYPPLDFLDNFRTGHNCGVPRMQTNKTYTITWSMGYSHQGGYKITLLDEDYTEIIQLVPSSENPQIRENYTAPHTSEYEESVVITLPPNVSCEHCVLKMERQALEWGENYRFHSCADVNIVPESRATSSAEHTCLNHGQIYNGSCDCDYLYKGDFCQYKDECLRHEHCGGEGKGWCAEAPGFTNPLDRSGSREAELSVPFMRKCYCKPPFFGKNCEKEFIPTQLDIMEGCFNFSFPTFVHNPLNVQGSQIVENSDFRVYSENL